MRNNNREYDLIIRHLLYFCNSSAKIFIRQFRNAIQLLFYLSIYFGGKNERIKLQIL